MLSHPEPGFRAGEADRAKRGSSSASCSVLHLRLLGNREEGAGALQLPNSRFIPAWLEMMTPNNCIHQGSGGSLGQLMRFLF